jgi:hypothetical protein
MKIKRMAKKQVTTKTATVSKPKYYIVLDSDMDLVCQGEWDDIKYELEEIMEDNNDNENLKMLSDFKLYELGTGKSINYIISQLGRFYIV